MIVVDTNVIACLHLAGEFTSRAESLLRQDPDWVAPILWRSELRNILAGYIRRNALSLEQARLVQAGAEDLMAHGEHEVDSQQVLQLVRDSSCPAYDCEFVALALQLNIKLATADSKLLQAFPDVTVPLPG